MSPVIRSIASTRYNHKVDQSYNNVMHFIFNSDTLTYTDGPLFSDTQSVTIVKVRAQCSPFPAQLRGAVNAWKLSATQSRILSS
ncbi:hypothetical protein TNCT_110651 [Trichonephila clavata]|uniref:Uncharacterized protein n=1 Tax=Trichonephila clavata TaxID=2740835 RepID=A0A8X6FXR7_TRICU|nr:hypothetical protein TNCT_110651 [Trichonephila clavata]